MEKKLRVSLKNKIKKENNVLLAFSFMKSLEKQSNKKSTVVL